MANQNHLAVLKKGVAAWNEWRRRNPEIRPDLSGANLGGANLSGADLRGVYLKEVKNLRRKQLEKAQTDEKTILPDYL